ncbi:hypothetical protein ACFQX4_27835 [Roseomonas sp. GCM10028921]
MIMRALSRSTDEKPPPGPPDAVAMGTVPSDPGEHVTVTGLREPDTTSADDGPKSSIERRIHALGELAETCRSAEASVRSRHDELLSGVAVTVCLASLAGFDQDHAWCADLATKAGLKWTATSSANPRAALCRITSRGLITANRASRIGSAVDNLIRQKGAELGGMTPAERESHVTRAFEKGVGAWLDKRETAAKRQPGPGAFGGPMLVGPGVELLTPGMRLRAVLERRDSGSVELVYLAAENARVALQPEPGWQGRALKEIKKADPSAQQSGDGDETVIVALAKPDLLRLVANRVISVVGYATT